MPRAELTITVPEEVWIGELSRSHPSTTFRVLAAVPDGEAGVGLVEIEGPDLRDVLVDMESFEAVGEINVLQQTGDVTLVQFETSQPTLLFPIQSSGIPLEMPFELADGEAIWEITASQDRLSTLGEQLDEFGIRYRVERIRQRLQPEQVLTDRQRRLVRTAVEMGYYDTPREASLTDLAEALGIAKSTCSETLHRAEERIVKRFVEELPD